MKAVGRYIIIKKENKTTQKTEGGLILGENDREDIRYREAVVVSVGSEVKFIENNDKIYYDRHAGFKIDSDKENLHVIKDMDVVVVL
tara:strand:- start:282 stop:542 length:261 start_codon:yes stop_codon:yes gene_type:complete